MSCVLRGFMSKIVCFQCINEKRENNCMCGYWHDLLPPAFPELDEMIDLYLNEKRNRMLTEGIESTTARLQVECAPT